MNCGKTVLFVWMIAFAYARDAAVARDLDPESLECIGCHSTYGAPSHHPVGMNYRQSIAGKPIFKDPSSLDPAIRLFDGNVGCATCHVPYFPYDHKMLSDRRKDMPSIPDPMLVVDNAKSGLCAACHLK